MIRVAIADDHRLLLEGLQEALNSVPDIEVVGVASDGTDIEGLVRDFSPDVLLVDIDMPGMDGLTALRRLEAPPPALVVTMHIDDEHRKRAALAGASGFLSKAIPLPDLAAAIRAAHAGEDLMDPTTMETFLDGHRQPVLAEGPASLTTREREILALLASGASSTDDLAARLFISQKTVKNHLVSIYHKLGISDRTQAAVEAIRLGLHRDHP
ncbi:MAG: response regulator transcription factor [Acidimicrobiia bacterium]|nr:response regulator transcription factor [Acidimicrobiia bacterium]MDH3470953.1 response regulator transcription factor [Acidimicrobiia bacterium]